MKKLISVLVVCSCLAGSLQAGFYGRAALLYNSPNDITVSGASETFSSAIDDSFGFSAALGFKFSAFRLEAEVNRLDTNIKDTDLANIITSGDYERTSFFGNVLFELPFLPMVKPYVGGGVGMSRVKVDYSKLVFGSVADSFTSSASESLWGYQIMAGVRISLFNTFTAYAGYRYMNLEAISRTEGNFSVRARNGTHLYELGVGIGF